MNAKAANGTDQEVLTEGEMECAARDLHRNGHGDQRHPEA
jgi:hypothetical protein